MSQARRFFRYSPWDALLAVGGAGIVAVIVCWFLYFSILPWWATALAFTAVTSSYCWNLQCISHNFIHNPFFSNVWLNRAFSVLETFALGVPQLLYHHYHLNHHAGDNDAKGPGGTTRDWSSIYRHSADAGPESFWRYCLLSFWRVEVAAVLNVVYRHGWRQMVQLAVEAVALTAFWVWMVLIDWRFFAFCYFPSYYLGWMLSYAEGYLEHYRCQPGNPFANSVSSYNALYNFLWFNNGYHQEHHWDPKVHWTRMHELHERIKPQMIANHTRVLRGPHLTAFIEDWLVARRKDSATATEVTEHRKAA